MGTALTIAMSRRIALTVATALLVSTSLSADQGSAARPRPVWTFVGIGAGFGAGLWVGLAAFDDSINSDRKVWTSAIVGAAAGGVLGYLVDRHRAKSQTGAKPHPSRLMSARDERMVISAAHGLGSGELKRWLGASSSPVLNWQLKTDN